MTYTGTPTNLTATPESGHIIQVQQVYPGLWSWSVTVGDLTVDCWEEGKFGNTKNAAKRRAGIAYRKLLKEQGCAI